MQYVRPFDPDKAVGAGFPGFRAQVLSHLESALMMSSHIKEGGCGPGLHYHRSDQLCTGYRHATAEPTADILHKLAGDL
jgi:hypothetical protein